MSPIIDFPSNCGNAPRKLFLIDYHRAIAEGNAEFLADYLADDINWEIVGELKITGKDEFLKVIQTLPTWEMGELRIETVVTHGNEAALAGIAVTEDGTEVQFCDVYKFKGAKGFELKSVKTFII